jgi:uncharacterized protein
MAAEAHPRATMTKTTEAPSLLRHEALVLGLLRPQAYPEAVDHIERIDTHISTVLLAGQHAYKIKKPLDLGFLDFSTLAKRRQACEDEVRLNRRTAPGIYLDVVRIMGSIEAPCIETDPAKGPAADVLEYAVRMRRFDPNLTLDRLALRGELNAPVVDDLATAVALLHEQAPRASQEFGSAARIEHWTQENFLAMRGHINSAADRARLDALEAWSTAEARSQAALMHERVAAGRVRECHGDLHLGNIVILDGVPVIFDAVEFNLELRCIDVINDVAFAFMDMHDHGLPRHAWRFVGGYLELTGDYEGLPLLRFYAVYRALVRAKVALIRLRQPQLSHHVRLREHTTFEHYLALAERLRQPGDAIVIAMTGLSGSGKSTVARCLAETLGGVRVRSDVERKRLFGLVPNAASEGDIYTAEATVRTYARLVECAQSVVSAGLPVVLDAASLRREERRTFRAVADRLGVANALVVCEAPLDVLRARVASRAALGGDASEADLAVLERQIMWREVLDQDEQRHAHVIDTACSPAQLEESCLQLGRKLQLAMQR